MPRTIVFGDIHGMLDELRRLIDALKVEQEDRLVFLGDLIDKGPDSQGVVQFVRENGWKCLKGNHEETALRWLRHEEKHAANPKYENPMKIGPDRFAPWLTLKPEDVAWLRTLPVTADLGGGTIAVHAGFMPRIPIDKQEKNHILRLRWVDDTTGKPVPMDRSPDGIKVPEGTHPWMEVWDGPQGVVYGHVVHTLDVPRVDIRPGGVRAWCYGIDTGGVHGGRLTALVFADETSAPQIVQVNADRVYVPFGIHGNGKMD
jgi:hypothetical protein